MYTAKEKRTKEYRCDDTEKPAFATRSRASAFERTIDRTSWSARRSQGLRARTDPGNASTASKYGAFLLRYGALASTKRRRRTCGIYESSGGSREYRARATAGRVTTITTVTRCVNAAGFSKQKTFQSIERFLCVVYSSIIRRD